MNFIRHTSATQNVAQRASYQQRRLVVQPSQRKIYFNSFKFGNEVKGSCSFLANNYESLYALTNRHMGEQISTVY